MTRVGLTPATFDPATMGERRLAFPEEEYAARLETLCELAGAAGIRRC